MDAGCEIVDPTLVKHVDRRADEPDIAWLVVAVIALAIHVERGVVPAGTGLDIAQEGRAVGSPLRVNADTAPAIAGVYLGCR